MEQEQGKVGQFFSTLWEFFLQSIVPNFYVFSVEKILKEKIEELRNRSFEIKIEGELDETTLVDEIKTYHKDESTRRLIIDDKAKANLFIIALSVTIILGSLSFIKDPGNKFVTTLPVLLLLIVGVAYLLLAGITAIKALNIREFYDIYLRDLVTEADGRLNVAKISNEDLICKHYKNTKLNELTNIIKSNYVYATFIGVRNGILLISIFFIIAVGSIYTSNHIVSTPKGSSKSSATTLQKKRAPGKPAKETTATPPARKTKVVR